MARVRVGLGLGLGHSHLGHISRVQHKQEGLSAGAVVHLGQAVYG